MDDWKPIEEAAGQSPQSDDYEEVLLTDGRLRRIGWIMERASGENRGMVSGHMGHRWTHWMPLPALPSP